MRDNDQLLMESIYQEEFSKRDELINYISDASKDLHGFRMRANWSNYTDEELERLADDISSQLSAHLEEEDKIRSQNDKKFSDEVEMMIERGARDEKQAIEWMFQADDVDPTEPYGIDEWLYRQQLSYKMEDKIKGIFNNAFPR